MQQKGHSMQTRKSLLIGMVIASLWAATGFVQPVWAQDGGHAGRGGMLLRLLYRVGLTDDQKAQVKQILASHRANLHSWRSQLQENRAALTDCDAFFLAAKIQVIDRGCGFCLLFCPAFSAVDRGQADAEQGRIDACKLGDVRGHLAHVEPRVARQERVEIHRNQGTVS